MNKLVMKPLLKDSEDYIQFFIEMEKDVAYSMNFKVYEVGGWMCDEDNTPTDLELYVHGTIKWDGCSHVYFGGDFDNPNGYLHLCGKDYWEKHNKVMTEIFKVGSETIEHYNKDVAE